MISRRKFVRHLSTAGAFLPIATTLTPFFDRAEFVRLTILHTNDVHSRVEPFPDDGSRNANRGGASRRAALIKKIRQEQPHVLLLDCGDMFQGTPYFNYFNGSLEIKLMNAMQYDVATIGNHDFDLGVEQLEKHLIDAEFEMVNGNYILQDSPIYDQVKPYTIRKKGGVKIGIFGVGIELEGLVPKSLYGDIVYQDPIKKAQEIADKLHHEEKCDFIICLSHLGYKYRNNKVSDVVLAESTRHINLILGGHTHTFLEAAVQHQNLDKKPVIINQVGWAGIMLGRLDVVFEKNKKGKCISCQNTFLGNKLEM